MKNAMRSATPHYTWIQGCYWMVYCILLSFSSVYLLEQGLSNTCLLYTSPSPRDCS